RWPSRSFMGLDWRRNGACDPWRGFALCRCGLGLLLLVPQISKASTSKSLPLGFPTLVAERFEFKLYSSWVVESFCALNFDFFFFTSILQLTVSMGLNGSSPRSSIVANAATRYAEDKPDRADEPLTTNSTVKSINEKLDMDAHVQEEAVVPTKRGAKIHDFCLGIPFGKPIPNFNSESFSAAHLWKLLQAYSLVSALSGFSFSNIHVHLSCCSNQLVSYDAVKESLSYRVIYFLKCCNDLLLLLCANLRRKPTTEEAGGSSPIITI
ncbi:hypothetical protein GW17_00020733, partial [Ensete ventricosum]